MYSSADDWHKASHKRVLIFGMSGLGKTRLSTILRDTGTWFHYSIDYRIGTRYMGEHIVDNALIEAMKVPFLRELLMKGSISIKPNLSFKNLMPVSTYIGKPGSREQGGLPIQEYQRRQEHFRRAEVQALYDTPHFIQRSELIYGYKNFICDTGGSICEWVNPKNPDDPILCELKKHLLMIWLKSDQSHLSELIARFDKSPKPMAYRPEFLEKVWKEYLDTNNCSEDTVNPDDFIRWTYSRALAYRQPQYEAMAKWGVAVDAKLLRDAQQEDVFLNAVGDALTLSEQARSCSS